MQVSKIIIFCYLVSSLAIAFVATKAPTNKKLFVCLFVYFHKFPGSNEIFFLLGRLEI